MKLSDYATKAVEIIEAIKLAILDAEAEIPEQGQGAAKKEIVWTAIRSTFAPDGVVVQSVIYLISSAISYWCVKLVGSKK